jgi:hypothetical protein
MSRRKLSNTLIHFSGQAADQGQSSTAPQEVAPPVVDEERQEINDAIANLADKIRGIGKPS